MTATVPASGTSPVGTGAIPDYDQFHGCLLAGVDEVLALAV